MPQTCSICDHPERLKIEAAIIARVPLRDIAGQFSVSRNAAHRHKQNCLKSILQAAQIAQETEQEELSAWNALEEMEWLRKQARTIYKETHDEHDYRLSLQSLGELRRQNELRSELTGELDRNASADFRREWSLMRDLIFETLKPFPEARIAVAKALLDLEDGQRGQAHVG